jgi:hypothetical protein
MAAADQEREAGLMFLIPLVVKDWRIMHWSPVASFLIGERLYDGALKAIGYSKLLFTRFGVANSIALARETFPRLLASCLDLDFCSGVAGLGCGSAGNPAGSPF